MGAGFLERVFICIKGWVRFADFSHFSYISHENERPIISYFIFIGYLKTGGGGGGGGQGGP